MTSQQYTCRHCDDETHKPLFVFDEAYCSDDCIASADYLTCDECSEYFDCGSHDAIYPEDGSSFCKDYCAEGAGYESCFECGKWTHKDNTCGDHNHRFCSHACLIEEHRICDECGTVVSTHAAHFTEHGTYCSYCLTSAECTGNDILYLYHTNPIHELAGSFQQHCDAHGFTRKTRLFGFEFEVKVYDVEEFVSEASALEGHGIWTEDGSVDAEFVSLPFPIETHLDVLRETFRQIERLNVAGYATRCDDETGFHVHVSRSTLTPVQIGKLDAVLNAPTFCQFFEKLSGRPAGSYYCSFKDETVKRGLKTVKAVKAGIGKHAERYRALNVLNSETIEFRLWKSPRTFAEAAARLQATEALCEYVAGAVDLRGPSDFVSFVMLTPGRWNELKDFLATA